MQYSELTYPMTVKLGQLLMEKGWLCTVAESCTGGLLAASITEVSGSSAWFDGGFVTYSNHAKETMLGVSSALINSEGAVSRLVAVSMAEGALARSRADISVAITGIAGPLGGTEAKPVGTVWIAWEGRGIARAMCYLFQGERAAIRQQSVNQALLGMIKHNTDLQR
jgi:nicotinamide-nucleotide amidase